MLTRSVQIFKIVAPYIMLSVFFADLNHRLGLPPFSLFMVALTLTDGLWYFPFGRTPVLIA